MLNESENYEMNVMCINCNNMFDIEDAQFDKDGDLLCLECAERYPESLAVT